MPIKQQKQRAWSGRVNTLHFIFSSIPRYTFSVRSRHFVFLALLISVIYLLPATRVSAAIVTATSSSSSLTAITAASPDSSTLTINLTGSASGGAASYTYLWNSGDGMTGSRALVSHTYSAAGTSTAMLTATNGASRTATASQTIMASSRSVVPPPNPFPSSLPSVAVTAYGATGDGGTDDTSAIRRAIAAAAVSGSCKNVFFPSGVYIIAGTLHIPSGMGGCGFFGEGDYGSTLKYTSISGYILVHDEAAGDGSLNNFYVYNLGFAGPGGFSGANWFYLNSAGNTHNVNIEHVYVSGFDG
jgi:PKD repeat protein